MAALRGEQEAPDLCTVCGAYWECKCEVPLYADDGERMTVNGEPVVWPSMLERRISRQTVAPIVRAKFLSDEPWEPKVVMPTPDLRA